MKVRRSLAMTAVLLPLVACKADNNVLQTWMGAPETRLFSVWGSPSNIVETQQGTRILTYHKEDGGSDLLPASGDDAREVASCEITFTVKDHRIVGFVYSGSGC